MTRRDGGFGLLEALLGVAILGICFGSVIYMMSGSEMNRDSRAFVDRTVSVYSAVRNYQGKLRVGGDLQPLVDAGLLDAGFDTKSYTFAEEQGPTAINYFLVADCPDGADTKTIKSLLENRFMCRMTSEPGIIKMWVSLDGIDFEQNVGVPGVFVDNVDGVDAPGRGQDSNRPYLTFAYALAQAPDQDVTVNVVATEIPYTGISVPAGRADVVIRGFAKDGRERPTLNSALTVAGDASLAPVVVVSGIDFVGADARVACQYVAALTLEDCSMTGATAPIAAGSAFLDAGEYIEPYYAGPFAAIQVGQNNGRSPDILLRRVRISNWDVAVLVRSWMNCGLENWRVEDCEVSDVSVFVAATTGNAPLHLHGVVENTTFDRVGYLLLPAAQTPTVRTLQTVTFANRKAAARAAYPFYQCGVPYDYVDLKVNGCRFGGNVAGVMTAVYARSFDLTSKVSFSGCTAQNKAVLLSAYGTFWGISSSVECHRRETDASLESVIGASSRPGTKMNVLLAAYRPYNAAGLPLYVNTNLAWND